MWICPRCNRQFRSRNQDHSCAVYPESHVFGKSSPVIFAVYKKLVGVIDTIGPCRLTFLNKAVMFSLNSTFLAIKPKKNYIEIEFLLDNAVNEFPVYKTFRVSARKVAHFIRLERPEDVDDLIGKWLTRAYHLNEK